MTLENATERRQAKPQSSMTSKKATTLKRTKNNVPNITLSIPVNTLMKPFDRSMPRPLENQPIWQTGDYEAAARIAADIDEQLTLRLSREGAKILYARDTHFGTVQVDGQIAKTELNMQRLKNGKAAEGAAIDEGKAKSSKLVYSSRQDEELKRVIEVNLTYDGTISEEQITRMLENLFVESSFTEARRWVKSYRSQAQYKTTAYFRAVMRDTIMKLGKGNTKNGLDLWKAAGKKEQQRFLVAMFDEGKVRCCLNAFPLEANATDYISMFCHSDRKSMAKWRRAMRSKFSFFASFVANNILREDGTEDSAGCRALHKHWKTYMRSEAMISLKLGEVGDVPTLPLRNVSKSYMSMDLFDKDVEVDLVDESEEEYDDDSE